MNESDLIRIINETKELRDIRDEYQKTYQLLQEHRLEELKNHLSSVIANHPKETIIHNISNPCIPTTIEQNAVTCMAFLENLFKVKLGVNVIDITKYLMK